MANGDAAAAAGMDLVSGTADRRLGYDEINKTRDYIAGRTLRHARGQLTTGSLAASNTASRKIAVDFPAGRFTAPPIVLITSGGTRVSCAAEDVTTTGFTLAMANYTQGIAQAFQVFWYAVEA